MADEAQTSTGEANPGKSPGEIAYTAYAEEVGWATFRGEQMRTWDALPTELKIGWMTAALAVREQHREEVQRLIDAMEDAREALDQDQ